jgi:uncharacterized membrane protein (UPF0127 family)
MYIKTKIQNYIFKTKVLTNFEEYKEGMMWKKFDNFDAMLFILKKKDQSFWMKNCIIPLDIIYIKNNIITKIHHNCPPCQNKNNVTKCQSYIGEGEFVLEINGGTCQKLHIEENDKIIFEKYNF